MGPTTGDLRACPLLGRLFAQLLARGSLRLGGATLEGGRGLVGLIGDPELSLRLQLGGGQLLLRGGLGARRLVPLETEPCPVVDQLLLVRGSGPAGECPQLAGLLGVRRGVEAITHGVMVPSSDDHRHREFSRSVAFGGCSR